MQVPNNMNKQLVRLVAVVALVCLSIAAHAAQIWAQAGEADWFGYPLGDPFPYQAGYSLLQPWAEYNRRDNNKCHAGEDWWESPGSPTAGDTVTAAANGVVRYAQDTDYPGTVVVIEHQLPDGNLLYTQYGHLDVDLAVAPDDIVSQGDPLGTVLDQGDNSHLHFEVRDFLTDPDINPGWAPGPGYWPPDGGNPALCAATLTDLGWFNPQWYYSGRVFLPAVLKNVVGSDPHEPNNTWGDATLLTSGQPMDSWIFYDGDVDYWYFKASASQYNVINLDLTSIPDGTDYDLYLYDQNHNLIASSENSGSASESIVWTILPGADSYYFAKVYPYYGWSNVDSYRLEVLLEWIPPKRRSSPTPTPPPYP